MIMRPAQSCHSPGLRWSRSASWTCAAPRRAEVEGGEMRHPAGVAVTVEDRSGADPGLGARTHARGGENGRGGMNIGDQSAGYAAKNPAMLTPRRPISAA